MSAVPRPQQQPYGNVRLPLTLQVGLYKELTSSSTVAGPLERSLKVPFPVPMLLSVAGLAPFDLGSSISIIQKGNAITVSFTANYPAPEHT